MGTDLRLLARSLRRSPASAVATVLTLSLTLGAGASIFTVIDAALLTPPPFKDPDALFSVGERPVDDPTAPLRTVGYATFETWRLRAASMAALEAVDGTNLTLTGLGAAERVSVSDVTPGFLTLLGVTPEMGRVFGSDDVGRKVAIISHGFWRGTLAADPDVIGRQIVLGSQSHTIVGVLPDSFVFELNLSDVWRPLPLTAAQAAASGYRVGVVARVAANVSASSLAAALDEVSRRSSPPARVAAVPISEAISGPATRTLGLLGAAAVLAVMIAFTNFAGLLIVRSIDRRRELAVRAALGARRSQIAWQLVLEAQALVTLGTAGGILLALWMTPLVGRLALEQFGGVAHRDVAVGWQVIAALALAASACAWICAALPAHAAARRSALDVLRRGATPAPRDLLWRRTLVTGEVALAFVLLVSVALIGGGLLQLLNEDPGFDARGVLAMQVSVPAAAYDSDRAASFYAALEGTLEERLGRRSASIVNEIPLAGSVGVRLAGAQQTDARVETVVREAGPAYFDVMRIPIVAGRSFEPRDDASVEPRAIISQPLAERLFAPDQPIGRQVWLAGSAQAAEVIGVVGDVKHRALDEPVLPTVYLAAAQSPSRSNIIVVRSRRPEAEVIAVVREEVARLDASVPVYRVQSMQDVVAASPGMPARRVLTATFMGFAALALALGAIGLFGVIAHDVASRRTELALRVALGADPVRIMAATLRQGALMVGWGLAAGSVLSIWAARTLSGVGFATDRVDLLSVSVPALVLIAAGAAAVLPAARRAARTDPLIVLRGE